MYDWYISILIGLLEPLRVQLIHRPSRKNNQVGNMADKLDRDDGPGNMSS